MIDLPLVLRLGAAIALGLLLGLERERKKPEEPHFAGVRTMALLGLLGAAAAHLSRDLELDA